MRWALIKGGVVENVVVAGADYTAAGYTCVQSDDAGPGWLYDAQTGNLSPPAPSVTPAVISFSAFMALFTPAEQLAIADSDDGQVRLFLIKGAAKDEVHLGSQHVSAGLDYLISLSLIASGRKADIVAGKPPA